MDEVKWQELLDLIDAGRMEKVAAFIRLQPTIEALEFVHIVVSLRGWDKAENLLNACTSK
jgi:hypothetical protein